MRIENNKGITLIALVITIIVLLILAGITISMVLGDDGIISQAQQAKEANEKGKGRDEGAISKSEGLISQYSMVKYDATKNGGIAMQNSTLNGEKASASNPVIPKGFQTVNVGDAFWGEEGAVDKGLVIQDEAGNQFVWVPVKNPEKLTTLTEGWTKNILQTWIGREQDVVTGETTTDENDNTIADLEKGTNYDVLELNRKAILEEGYENSIEGLKKQFEDEYNSMKVSVKAYGGFYVGRYETGWDDIKKVVVSKKGVPMTASTSLEKTWSTSNPDNENKSTWYGLYIKQKELYSKNSSSSVVSGMIYGCQWDAIMKWMLSSSNENTREFVKNSTGAGWYSDNYEKGNVKHLTGKDLNSADGTTVLNKVNNIYDLAGNYWEFTQESRKTDYRVVRGGYFKLDGTDYPASNRNNGTPTDANASFSSRLQLYIK